MITIVDYGGQSALSREHLARRRQLSDTRDPKVVRAGESHFAGVATSADAAALDTLACARRSSKRHGPGTVPGNLPWSASHVRVERGGAGGTRSRVVPGRVERFPRMPACRTWAGTRSCGRQASPNAKSRVKPYVYFAHSFYCPVTPQTAARASTQAYPTRLARNRQHLRRSVSSGEVGAARAENRRELREDLKQC